MSDSYYLGISKDRIARIWEGPDGFTVTDFWGRNLGVYGNDADAGERARDLGYEEIFWEDVQEATMDGPENFYAPSTEHPEKDLPQSPPPTPAINLKANQVARLIRDGYEFRLAEPDGITPMTPDEAQEYINLMRRGGYRATAPQRFFNLRRARWFAVEVERTPATPKITAARMGRDDELAASVYGQ